MSTETHDSLSLSLHVEIIAGTDIKTAAQDMCTLSKRLGIMVTSDFNGCYLIATEKTHSIEIDGIYNFYLSSKNKKRKSK